MGLVAALAPFTIALALAIALGAPSSPPSVAFVARWGGGSKDLASAIALDARGGVYVAGSTYSADFPITTGHKTTGNWCAFATKLSSDSGAPVYSTALCTKAMTHGFAAALAADGELWVAGSTDGGELPVTEDAAQRTFGGSSSPTGSGDAILLRWSADGRRLRYATYFGGADDERANALLADEDGGVWMAGTAGTRGFLAHYDPRGRLTSSTFSKNAIVAMSRADSHRLLTSTVDSLEVFDTTTSGVEPVLRGSGYRLRALAMTPHGRAVVAGERANCPEGHGREDGWLVSRTLWSDVAVGHCVGGSGVDEIHGLASAKDGSVWITGLTNSRDFPVTTSGPGRQPDYDPQAFIANLDPVTGAIRFATLLGTDSTPRRDISRGYAVAVGADGSIFATGETTGAQLLLPTKGAFRQGQIFESTDVYLVKLR
jgi:hypothetical protein